MTYGQAALSGGVLARTGVYPDHRPGHRTQAQATSSQSCQHESDPYPAPAADPDPAPLPRVAEPAREPVSARRTVESAATESYSGAAPAAPRRRSLWR